MTDLSTLDATAQAELVRTGEASPAELVEAAINRIEKLNPQLNAVIHERFDLARAAAASRDLPDGPFKGVPMLFKDLMCALEGEPYHEGMRFLKDAGYVSPHTDHLAEQYLAAGFVPVGRTNTPELGLLPTTEPEAYGPTHNPWKHGHTTGGSSGGSAAAVASGMVPIAHANDGGGSIRIPASACGLVGLKPTRGRTSLGPDQSELVSFLTVELCVSRSVRDTAGVLQAVHGRFPGDPTTAPLPAHPYTDEVGADPGKLRIGLMTTDPLAGGPMHPDCVAAAESTARLLESLGHEVEISQPPGMADPELLTKFSMVWAANCAYYVDDFGHKVGREATAEDVELLTWAMTEFGRSVTAPAYLDAIADAVRFSRRAASWWYGSEGFDLLLTPTLGEPPLPHGTLDSTPENPLAGFARSATFTPCTAQFNMTGQPAISLPMHWNDDNLPIGIQLVADFAREDLLIRIASQLEEAQPWADRVPPVHA